MPALKQAYRRPIPRVKQLIDVGRRLEGLVRHASTHAAGVVIAPKPIVEFAPLYRGTDDAITTQFAMADIEEIGLLKMDFLGLKTLTLIEDALASIAAVDGRRGRTSTRCRSTTPRSTSSSARRAPRASSSSNPRGCENILRRLKPDRFEDLVAINALYRPGPIGGGLIDDFIKRRHGKVQVSIRTRCSRRSSRETYGVIVYQEQVMQIASRDGRLLAGRGGHPAARHGQEEEGGHGGRARAASSSARAAQEVKAKDAGKVFDQMEFFAGYGFNKSALAPRTRSSPIARRG